MLANPSPATSGKFFWRPEGFISSSLLLFPLSPKGPGARVVARGSVGGCERLEAASVPGTMVVQEGAPVAVVAVVVQAARQRQI